MAVCARCGSLIPAGRKDCDLCEPTAASFSSGARTPRSDPPPQSGSETVPEGPGTQPASVSPTVPGDAGATSGAAVGAPGGRSTLKAKLPIIAVAVALLLAISGGAAAAIFFLKPGTAVEKLVPGSADVYAIVYMDPPIGQKANLLSIAHRFPDLKTDQDTAREADEALNKAFKDSGLSYTNDVRPWLGSQLGIAAKITDPAQAVFLIASKNDSKARAALAKVRNSEQARKLSWSQETYRGVAVSVGTPASGNAKDTLVYAYVDHTVVLGNSVAFVREVIDTDQGKMARLVDSTNYKTTMSRLPAEKLALVYVNGKAVSDRLKEEATKESRRGVRVTVPQKSLDQLDAFRGLGFALVAKPNGLAANLAVMLDPSKLAPETRAALSAAPHKNRTLEWIPRRAYGLLMTTSLKQSVQPVVDQLTTSPEAKQVMVQFGLTGPTGALAHLTGDAALEVDHGTSRYPAGAILLATDDTASMQTFLDKVAAAAQQELAEHVPGGAVLKKETFHGVTITSLSGAQLNQLGLAPAYAVTNGLGIVASSPQEVRALIQAHETGQNVTSSERFQAVSKESFQSPDSVFYVDIAETAGAVRDLLPEKERKEYDSKVAPDLDPLKAFMMTSQNGGDQVSEDLFLLIP